MLGSGGCALRLAARAVVMSVVAAMCFVAAPAPAGATYPGSNGLLLVSTKDGLGLVSVNGGAVTPVAGWKFDNSAARLSPGGDKVAYSTNVNDQVILRVRSASGVEAEVARVTGEMIQQIAWSPDGKQIMFLVDREGDHSGDAGGELDNGEEAHHDDYGVLYKVASSGGKPTIVRSFYDSRGIHLDWHPTRDLLAVTWGSDIWTMNSSGGSVTQWTNECAYDGPFGSNENESGDGCDLADDMTSRWYDDEIRWESSGDALAVGMVRFCDERSVCGDDKVGIGRLKLGSKVADPVVLWTPGTSWANGIPVPSPDGRWYGYQDEKGTFRLVNSAGASGSASVKDRVLDWQACGAGGCPVFRSGGKPTSITLVNTLGGACTPKGCTFDSLVTTGKVTPKLSKLPVDVTLHVFRGNKWSLAAKKRVKLTKSSTYKASFKVPKKAVKCRVTASFPGNATYAPSSITKTYRC